MSRETPRRLMTYRVCTYREDDLWASRSEVGPDSEVKGLSVLDQYYLWALIFAIAAGIGMRKTPRS